jgi:hypothetical protein
VPVHRFVQRRQSGAHVHRDETATLPICRITPGTAVAWFSVSAFGEQDLIDIGVFTGTAD